jgi:hypothetical protein
MLCVRKGNVGNLHLSVFIAGTDLRGFDFTLPVRGGHNVDCNWGVADNFNAKDGLHVLGLPAHGSRFKQVVHLFRARHELRCGLGTERTNPADCEYRAAGVRVQNSRDKGEVLGRAVVVIDDDRPTMLRIFLVYDADTVSERVGEVIGGFERPGIVETPDEDSGRIA